jgi:23S rRNA pseudouridine1911/1915/1917 synthase
MDACPRDSLKESIRVAIVPRVGRLDVLLKELGGFTSRASAQRAIASGLVHVGGQLAIKPSMSLKVGESIGWLPWPEETRLKPSDWSGGLSIIYEDEHLLVVNKQRGLLVHPGAGRRTPTLIDRLRESYPEIAHVGEPARPGIVHRLDKDTTGALIVAKTIEAHGLLSRQFAERVVKKEYWALVWGKLSKSSGELMHTISRSPRDKERFTTRPGRGRGRRALSSYSLISCFGFVSLVALFPLTGRTHQLRVQTVSIGHPIVGDRLYGPKRPPFSKDWPLEFCEATQGLEGQLLHARKVCFLHPFSLKTLVVEAPLPFDFSLILGLLSPLGKGLS